MPKRIGGVRLRLRPVDAEEERSAEWRWANAVVPNQEATETRARQAAAILIAHGESRVWVCRSKHKLAGVWEFRYYTLTEATVRLLGGYIAGEVITVVESQPEEKRHEAPKKPRKNPGDKPGGNPGRHARGGRRITV